MHSPLRRNCYCSVCWCLATHSRMDVRRGVAMWRSHLPPLRILSNIFLFNSDKLKILISTLKALIFVWNDLRYCQATLHPRCTLLASRDTEVKERLPLFDATLSLSLPCRIFCGRPCTHDMSSYSSFLKATVTPHHINTRHARQPGVSAVIVRWGFITFRILGFSLKSRYFVRQSKLL